MKRCDSSKLFKLAKKATHMQSFTCPKLIGVLSQMCSGNTCVASTHVEEEV